MSNHKNAGYFMLLSHKEVSKENFINQAIELPGTSRVWIYQVPRPLSHDESILIRSRLETFLRDWNAHGSILNADAALIFNQFIVFTADESKVAASGCSIDQSVRVIRELGDKLSLDLFDRQLFAYLDDKEKVRTIPLDSLGKYVSMGSIGPGTLVFDPLVPDLSSFFNSWIKPLSESWQVRFLDARA